MIPGGAVCLYNPVGTAPGFSLKIGRCTFFFLPGVPHEMKKMLTEQVLVKISALLGADRRFNQSKTLSAFGLAESVVGEKVGAVETLFPEVALGLRAKFPEIQVKLYHHGNDRQAGAQVLNEAGRWVMQQLGPYVFSEDQLPMAAEVGKLLTAKKATLAVADVFLGRPGLHPIVELLDGSRRTQRVIRRNLVFSLAYNLVAVSLAIAGLMHPLVAAILMPLSSITVVVSSYKAKTF